MLRLLSSLRPVVVPTAAAALLLVGATPGLALWLAKPGTMDALSYQSAISSADDFALRGSLKPENNVPSAWSTTTDQNTITSEEPVAATVTSSSAPQQASAFETHEAYPQETRSSWGGTIVFLGALLFVGIFLRRLSHWFDH